MTINCKGVLINLNKPKILGILNITPDSFFDGGKYNTTKKILKQCEKMINEGADFIDIGAQSSRPGSKELSLEEELNRLMPNLENLIKEFPEIPFSIDTYRSKIAEESINIGASIINDISSGNLDSKMMEVVGRKKVPYIMMHMKGNPLTMQINTNYKNVVTEIIEFFSKKIKQAYSFGINDLIIDPGFGFGKNIDDNFRILNHLELFNSFNLPVMVGISRKSMIYKKLGINSQQSLNGTSVLNTISLTKKIKILRVHDVREAKECIDLLQELE
tara:strand:- start:2 stop:823 length:822 start_codon:yes stop_codon:yes gene_type:complete